MPTTSDGDIDMTISLSGEYCDIIDQDPIWNFLRKGLGEEKDATSQVSSCSPR
jgi:hypothetical protein